MANKFATKIIEIFGKFLSREKPPQRAYLCDFERIRMEVRPADVLLIEGRSRLSTIIRTVTHSTWTHASLYIGKLHDIDSPKLRRQIKKYYKGSRHEPLLIESVIGEGTIVRPLSHYRADHIRIARPQGITRQDAQHVIAYAISHLGRSYSIRHIFDLFRFLFPWELFPREWRSSLFQQNALKPTEEICSTLIAQAFQSVSFPILPLITKKEDRYELTQRNPRLFTPSDFDYSPFFAIIKYPILDLPITPYRTLPWRKNEQNNRDKNI